MNERTLNLLYRSFDDQLSEQEQSELSEALSASADLREEKRRIEQVRISVSETAERSFKAFFSSRVMRQLENRTEGREDYVAALVWAFRRVAMAGAVAILLLVATSILRNSRSLESILGLPQVTLEDTWKLDYLIDEAIP